VRTLVRKVRADCAWIWDKSQRDARYARRRAEGIAALFRASGHRRRTPAAFVAQTDADLPWTVPNPNAHRSKYRTRSQPTLHNPSVKRRSTPRCDSQRSERPWFQTCHTAMRFTVRYPGRISVQSRGLVLAKFLTDGSYNFSDTALADGRACADRCCDRATLWVRVESRRACRGKSAWGIQSVDGIASLVGRSSAVELRFEQTDLGF
jgi:hypothetical protein